ncbi:hypothetical protein Enr13x_43010 [Stieleria neptunia]|uniref:Uncharacterized protein n=1 Tax=Stieleria neptunia TaxID=2527979 RepID=A0A518HUA5_9BACT|nr:hypothetical protein [Stieleria neptunia]QDV44435.1 hypothetical protein Enr13x_43010 [Stieleria neptunia]
MASNNSNDENCQSALLLVKRAVAEKHNGAFLDSVQSFSEFLEVIDWQDHRQKAYCLSYVPMELVALAAHTTEAETLLSKTVESAIAGSKNGDFRLEHFQLASLIFRLRNSPHELAELFYSFPYGEFKCEAYQHAQWALVAVADYETCGKFLSIDESLKTVESKIQLLEVQPPKREIGQTSGRRYRLLVSIFQIIALHATTGRREEAMDIRDRLYSSNIHLRSREKETLNAALRGVFPS